MHTSGKDTKCDGNRGIIHESLIIELDKCFLLGKWIYAGKTILTAARKGGNLRVQKLLYKKMVNKLLAPAFFLI